MVRSPLGRIVHTISLRDWTDWIVWPSDLEYCSSLDACKQLISETAYSRYFWNWNCREYFFLEDHNYLELSEQLRLGVAYYLQLSWQLISETVCWLDSTRQLILEAVLPLESPRKWTFMGLYTAVWKLADGATIDFVSGQGDLSSIKGSRRLFTAENYGR